MFLIVQFGCSHMDMNGGVCGALVVRLLLTDTSNAKATHTQCIQYNHIYIYIYIQVRPSLEL